MTQRPSTFTWSIRRGELAADGIGLEPELLDQPALESVGVILVGSNDSPLAPSNQVAKASRSDR
jgi:hypothetical protein